MLTPLRRPPARCACLALAASILACGTPTRARGQAIASEGSTPRDAPKRALELQDLSLDELLSVRLTSASRKAEALSTVPAAAHVITADDIRRSGATSIPDLLRMVPGLHVAQLSPTTWAVGARGFAATFSDKLLVLVDGRSVYTPLFSGVSWDTLDLPLADIERIEVIRGPGAAMWGPNAVNGVINIIPKSAEANVGTHVRLRSGTHEDGMLHARHGFTLPNDAHLSLSVRSSERGDWKGENDPQRHADWRSHSAALRLELPAGNKSRLSLSAGAYRSDSGLVYERFLPEGGFEWIPATRETHGEHLLVRWTREPGEGRSLTLQGWASHAHRDEPDYSHELTSFDIELTKRLPVGQRHDVTWGVGMRRTDDRVEGSFDKSFHHGTHRFRLLTAFAQDEIRLNDTTRLTVAARLQRDEFGNTDVQPTVRIGWQATHRLFAWGAASRALRTVSRIDHDVRMTVASEWNADAGMLQLFRVEGRGQHEPEWATSFEAGLRWSHGERLVVDVAGFATTYEGLRTYELEDPRIDIIDGHPVLILPARVDNKLSSQALGLELGVTWRPLDRLRLRMAASALDVDFRNHAGSTDIYWDSEGIRGNTPRRRAFLVAQIELPHRLELDVSLEHAAGWVAPGMSDTTRAGLRLGWRPTSALGFELGVRDLFHSSTREHSGLTPFTHVEPVPRAFHFSITWSF